MGQKVGISGHTMISIQQEVIPGLIGMLVIIMILPSHSTVLQLMSIVLLSICLVQCLFRGTNRSIITGIKENVDVVVIVVVIAVAAVIHAVTHAIGSGVVQVTVVVIIVVGIIAVAHAVADGIILGEHLSSQEEQVQNSLIKKL